MTPIFQRISSSHNSRIKRLRRLTDARHREKTGLILLEGGNLVREALRAGLSVVDVLISESALNRGRVGDLVSALATAGITRVAVVPDAVLSSVSSMRTPHDVVAVAVGPPAGKTATTGKPVRLRGMVVALDGVQDPGNAGTIIRTALGFGCDRVWLDPRGVDPFHPKVLRATAGSIFWFAEIRRVPLPAALAEARAQGMTVVALDPKAGEVLGSASVGSPDSLVVVAGGEGAGITPEVRRQVDRWLRIPLDSRVESLNVAVATALALYVLRASVV